MQSHITDRVMKFHGSLASNEAFRVILDHEKIPYTRCVGVGGDWLFIDQEHEPKLHKVVQQWYVAATYIFNAVDTVHYLAARDPLSLIPLE